MSKKTVGIFSYPWKEHYNERNPFELFSKAVWYKANPRNEEYMRTIFHQSHPGGEFVNADTAGDLRESISKAQEIILLYPDSVGLGFDRMERFVWKNKGKQVSVYALNGRRREFPLDLRARKDLRVRRVIERCMLGEIVITILFLAATPLLLFFDLVRGKR